ncbi:MAG: class I SAM-dependent methyltransferase [Gammaproteobacteria bacterium]|nr:class I SAM-dependent methyltransferase [Gammaproteobacteria bacterium]MCH9716325.1 class I SAM-dependent methyltransferase [Gammaproteobacteria bacterium]MCH9763272.1 class I SAM-dependent methyltransferase [Gammaproteobacteria bacterium]
MKHLNLTAPLYQYLLNTSVREHPVLQTLREKTAELPLGIMQVAPEQAQFMQFLLRILNAKKVLELGTFTGYSALAMALVLPDDGRITTCDINTEWTDKAKPFWDKAKQTHKINLKIGQALDSLNHLLDSNEAGTFDFIFIDADKTNYLTYYELALKLIKPTGIIAIDNMLWSGEVINPENTRAQTREIRKLNSHIKQDSRVNISLLPIADGLFLIRPK